MVTYDKIVEDPLEPRATNVLWLRPIGDGFSFYRYKNGHWEALKMVDDKGTASPDDDTEMDVPSMDNIDDKIQKEVTEQMAVHDENVKDVHYEESTDTGEYPDYSDII